MRGANGAHDENPLHLFWFTFDTGGKVTDTATIVARTGAAGQTMLSHSFAFGGTNAVLALRAAD